ncbi:MAG TPA: undecaprenyl-diphosphatase UppP [Thermoanaerobaculia bacterium]|nr:undecaprenyl-diphosphatase UppP [Thermoanaerobaculia bacterium]
MSILEAVVLGLVQGLTEFIPISSTGHLKIVPELLGWGDPGAPASAVIQFGTILAVLIYFAADLRRLAAGFFRGLGRRTYLADPDFAEAWYVILGTIPIVIVGLLLKKQIETTFRSTWIVAGAMIIVAVLMQISEVYARNRGFRDWSTFSGKDALIIGLGQCLSLVPGSSRSGSTIMTALFRRIPHAAAARFSFVMSIPAITAAGLLELIGEWEELALLGWVPILVATLVAFVSGYASIAFLLRYLRTHSTHIFIYYRYVLGAVMIVLLLTGWMR